MKYFDKSFMNGELSDEEYDKRIKTYNMYIDEVLKKSNFKIRLFIKNLSLHDATILTVNTYNTKLNCRILIGDNQKGRTRLLLSFLNYNCNNIEKGILPFKIAYYELYRTNRYCLSLISDDFREAEINFSDISIYLE